MALIGMSTRRAFTELLPRKKIDGRFLRIASTVNSTVRLIQCGEVPYPRDSAVKIAEMSRRRVQDRGPDHPRV